MAVAGPAAAKGPTSVTITDPAGHSTTLPAATDGERNHAIMLLAEDMGLWEAIAPQGEPLPADPPVHPGAEFRVEWTLFGPSDDGRGDPAGGTVVQSLHPQARGGPLVYTRAGAGRRRVGRGGGWYRASSRLPSTLEALGWETKWSYIEGEPAVDPPRRAGRVHARRAPPTRRRSPAERGTPGPACGPRPPAVRCSPPRRGRRTGTAPGTTRCARRCGLTASSAVGTPLDDRELVARAKEGDVDAYAALLRTHGHVARRLAGRVRCGRRGRGGAGRVRQGLVRARPVPRGSAFRPWLLRIVANEARNRRRAAAAGRVTSCGSRPTGRPATA